jgi:hypothetical protein
MDSNNLLRQCAQRLVETAERLTSSASATSSDSTADSASTTSTARQGTAREEHNRVFGYRPPPARRNIGNTGSQRRQAPYGSKPKHGTTWSRAFVCLASAGQQHAPSTEERIELTFNGLGEKKFIFPQEGNSAQVHEVLLEALPALQEDGGYEILRTGDGRSKEFILLPMPTTGFSVPYLRSVLGQAKAYMRPLQKDITLTNNTDDVNDSKVRGQLLLSLFPCSIRDGH